MPVGLSRVVTKLKGERASRDAVATKREDLEVKFKELEKQLEEDSSGGATSRG